VQGRSAPGWSRPDAKFRLSASVLTARLLGRPVRPVRSGADLRHGQVLARLAKPTASGRSTRDPLLLGLGE